jgi:hypothetical protein
MQVANLRNIYRLLALLTVSFAGGILSVAFWGWFKGVSVGSPGDAVSIANTYIVFTTIIFVGFTVVLGVAGYVFTQQFSTTKEMQTGHLIKEVEDRLRDDADFGVSFIEKVMSNPDVIRHVDCMLAAKIMQLLKDRSNNKQKAAEQAQQESQELEALISQIEE